MARAEITGRKSKVTQDQAKRCPGPPRADPKAIEPTVHDLGEFESAALPPIRGPPVMAFSIAEFCHAHRLSQSMYFKLKNQGLAPTEMIVGRRKLISFEAAEAWRRAREAAAEAVAAA